MTDRPDLPAEAIKAGAKALVAEGGAPDNSIHGWRCKYPDRYGPCDCVEETVKVVLAAALPHIRDEQCPAGETNMTDFDTATTAEERSTQADRLMLWLGSERDKLVVEVRRTEGDLAVAVAEAQRARAEVERLRVQRQAVLDLCRRSDLNYHLPVRRLTTQDIRAALGENPDL
jgi:hypothetical protein